MLFYALQNLLLGNAAIFQGVIPWDGEYIRSSVYDNRTLLRTESLAMPEAVPASGRV